MAEKEKERQARREVCYPHKELPIPSAKQHTHSYLLTWALTGRKAAKGRG